MCTGAGEGAGVGKRKRGAGGGEHVDRASAGGTEGSVGEGGGAGGGPGRKRRGRERVRVPELSCPSRSGDGGEEAVPRRTRRTRRRRRRRAWLQKKTIKIGRRREEGFGGGGDLRIGEPVVSSQDVSVGVDDAEIRINVGIRLDVVERVPWLHVTVKVERSKDHSVSVKGILHGGTNARNSI